MAVERAKTLIGKPRSEYQCNHVVNYALNGDKNTGGTAKYYLTWGTEAKDIKAGDVVVGTDGQHCGFFIAADKFIHSSSSQAKVIEAPLSQLKYVFPGGHKIRRSK